MSSAMAAAGASSSYTATFSRNPSLKTSSYLHPQSQRSSFQGVAVEEGRRAALNSLVLEGVGKSVGSVRKRGLEISARTAGAAKNIEVEVDKPLGLTLGQKQGGGVIITVSICVYIYCVSIDVIHGHIYLAFTNCLKLQFNS